MLQDITFCCSNGYNTVSPSKHRREATIGFSTSTYLSLCSSVHQIYSSFYLRRPHFYLPTPLRHPLRSLQTLSRHVSIYGSHLSYKICREIIVFASPSAKCENFKAHARSILINFVEGENSRNQEISVYRNPSKNFASMGTQSQTSIC
jgi:hypothetical protein